MGKLSIPALDAAHRASDDNPVELDEVAPWAFASRFSVTAAPLADPPTIQARATALLF